MNQTRQVKQRAFNSGAAVLWLVRKVKSSSKPQKMMKWWLLLMWTFSGVRMFVDGGLSCVTDVLKNMMDSHEDSSIEKGQSFF
jgi:hypothetical protein